MMEFYFSWLTSLGEYANEADPYFMNYFVEGNACTSAFWIAFGIALIMAVLFYFVVCNRIYALSNRLCWWVTLLATLVVTYLVTGAVVIGHYDDDSEACTGFYASIENTRSVLLEPVAGNTEETENINNQANDLIETLNDGSNDFPVQFGAANGGIAFFFFLLFSLLFKGFTKHGPAVPCVFPRRLHK